MNTTPGADQKPLYCHWDTHVDDVLFTNEADLDRHIYGHFMQNNEVPNYLAPTPASPQPRSSDVPLPTSQTIECHWDACHELFEIDQIMQHLRESHMQGSLHPHMHECGFGTHGCELPSPKSEGSSGRPSKDDEAFHRLSTYDASDEHSHVQSHTKALHSHGDSLAQNQAQAQARAQANAYAHSHAHGHPHGHAHSHAHSHVHSHAYSHAHSHAHDHDDSGTTASGCGCSSTCESPDCCSGTCSSGPLPQNGVPGIDTSSLPQLPTISAPGPQTETRMHCCMWCSCNGSCCGEKFMTSPELHAHIVHDHVMKKPASMCSCGWQGCTRDGKPFGQRQKLIRHLQTHAKTFDFKCRICGRALSCESMRRMHERSHSNEKPFKCEMCGSRFRAHSSLIVHQRTHTGEKPLACKFPGCDKRFAESSNLAKHMRTHQEKAFECEFCHRKFTRKDHLLRHKRTRCHRHLEEAALQSSQAQQNLDQLPLPNAAQVQPVPAPVLPSYMYAMNGSGSQN